MGWIGRVRVLVEQVLVAEAIQRVRDRRRRHPAPVGDLSPRTRPVLGERPIDEDRRRRVAVERRREVVLGVVVRQVVRRVVGHELGDEFVPPANSASTASTNRSKVIPTPTPFQSHLRERRQTRYQDQEFFHQIPVSGIPEYTNQDPYNERRKCH